MSGAIAVIVGLALLVLLAWYPLLSVALLLAVPLLKVAGGYYVPLFQTIDLTVLTCAIVGVAAVWNYIRQPGSRLGLPWSQAICLLTIGLVLLLGLLWTTAPSYGLRKVIRFLGIGIPFLLLPAFFVRSRKDAHRAIRMVIFVGALATLAIIAMPRSYLSQVIHGRGYARTTFMGSDPAMAATLIALGILGVVCMFVVKRSASRFIRYATFIIVPAGLLAMVSTGTRSGLLGLAAAALVLPLLSGRKSGLNVLLILLFVFPLALYVIFTADAMQSLLVSERWEHLVEPSGASAAAASRLPHYTFCLANWWGRPVFGHGSGSFAMDLFHADTPAWPHNIVLEVLYEAGLAGAVTMVIFFLVTAREGRRGLRQATDPQDRLLVLAPLAMLLLLFVQAMTHWDINGARYLFFFAGLLHANVAQLNSTVVSRTPQTAFPWSPRAPAWPAQP